MDAFRRGHDEHRKVIENRIRAFFAENLPKLVLAASGAVYPLPFACQKVDYTELSLDLPIVGHQLICTEKFQFLSYFLMEMNSFVTLSTKMFPHLARNDGLKMLVSANNEILNTVTSKMAFILTKIDASASPIITPPVVMNYSNSNRAQMNCADTIFFRFQSQAADFRFASTVQAV